MTIGALVTNITTGTTGIPYSAWIILVIVAAVMSLLGIMIILNDRKGTTIPMLIFIIAAMSLCFVAAILAGALDFLDSVGDTVTYTGLWWSSTPLMALGALDFLVAIVGAVSLFRAIQERRGY